MDTIIQDGFYQSHRWLIVAICGKNIDFDSTGETGMLISNSGAAFLPHPQKGVGLRSRLEIPLPHSSQLSTKM
jgi:hypothetical protein